MMEEFSLGNSRRSIHELIANQHSKASRANEHLNRPQIGLLYRTLEQSPLVNWILPARIRDVTLNDLVFVGEDFVHVKEICRNGSLRHVATKADFKSKIRAAAVMGITIVPDGYHDDGDDDEKNDWAVVAEDYQYTIPPNFLVLSLDCGELVFLCARQDGDKLIFQEGSIPLPKGQSLVRQIGFAIAVDPCSKILAVAANLKWIKTMVLKDWDTLNREFLSAKDEWVPMPIKHESAIPFKGKLLNMTFLNPGVNGLDSFILILLTKDQRTRLWCYQGSHSRLDQPTAIVKGVKLEDEYANPDLVIPYKHSPNFILVCGPILTVVSNVLTHTPSFLAIDTYPEDTTHWEPKRWGIGNHFPIYTAYTHAIRAPPFARRNREHIYVMREDGLLLSMDAEPRNGFAGIRFRVAGNIDCNGSTGLAAPSLSNNFGDPDVLVTAGCMSDGRMIQIGQMIDIPAPRYHARINPENQYDIPVPGNLQEKRQEAMDPILLQLFPNWAPICDFKVLLPSFESRPSIFVTSGRQPHGTIRELRVGHKAEILMNAYLDIPAATRLLTVKCQDCDVFFVAFPERTDVFRNSGSDMSQIHVFEEEILCVCHTMGLADCFMLAMPSSLTLCSMDQDGLSMLHRYEFNSTAILAIHFPGQPMMAVVCGNSNNATSLDFYRTTDEGDSLHQIGQHTELQAYPNCLSPFDFNESKFLLIGTLDGSLYLHTIHPKGHSGATLLASFSTTSTPSNTVESLAILFSDQSTSCAFVCGLRGGTIQTGVMDMDPISKELKLLSSSSIIIGPHPVSIFPDPHFGPVAFAVCGSETLRVTFENDSQISISNVWFTDTIRPTYPQPDSPLISVMNTLHHGSLVENTIALVADGWLLLATVDWQKSLIPRVIPLLPKSLEGSEEAGTPLQLANWSTAQFMVVGAQKWAVVQNRNVDPLRPWKGKRVSKSMLYFLDTSVSVQPTAGYTEWIYPITAIPLSPKERINCICEWNVQLGNLDNMLVVGTSEQLTRGRVYFFVLTKDDEGHRAVKVQGQKTVENSVDALAVYDNDVIVIASALNLDVYGFVTDPASESRYKLKLLTRTHLPDKVRQLSVSKPFIYASTQEKSLTVYKLDKQESDDYNIQKYFGDGQSRPTISHAVVDLPADFHGRSFPNTPKRLVFLVDLNSQLTILEQPDAQPLLTGTRPLLVTKMPHMLSRVDSAILRPPWRRSSPFLAKFPELLATSPSGAIVHLRLLPEALAKLLAFLSRLVEYTKQGVDERRNTYVDPMPVCVSPDQPRYYPPETNDAPFLGQIQQNEDAEKSNLVSSADKLVPLFFAKDAREKLLGMITQPAWERLRQNNLEFKPERVGNDEAGRKTLFLELVEAVKEHLGDSLGERRADEMELDGDELENVVDWCVKWMKQVLEDVY